MNRSLLTKTPVACALVGLLWLSACSNNDKIYEDRYETVQCRNCPPPKYVYKKAPRLPDRVVRVHRTKLPCPPQRVVEVQLPPEPGKIKYEYVDEGSCEPIIKKASYKEPRKSPCKPTCRKACCRPS
ncbi:MAG TPA: hypothetical protein VJZ71_10690 [Phycisphaerae bacterium]|nr:hypothetical protein [Phycisphaerae bacterium]